MMIRLKAFRLQPSALRTLLPPVQNPQLRIPLRFLRSIAANSFLLRFWFAMKGEIECE